MIRMSKCIVFLAVALMLGCGEEQNEQSTAGPTSCDICGSWTADKEPLGATGVCGAGPTEQGQATISMQDGAYVLSLSGITCSPPEACTFSGVQTDSGYVFSNGGPADDEGGTYASNMVLEFDTDTTATGTSVATYTVEGEVLCTWDVRITLAR